MKVALFIPCLTEHLFPKSAISMVKIFNHLGLEVEYIEDQTCCGQPAYNSGHRKEVIPLAEKFIKLFAGQQYIVAPSGSCVSFIKHHYVNLPLDSSYGNMLGGLTSRIFEFTEFIVDVLKLDTLGGEFAHTVTYHDSCHLLRNLGVREQPRKLISSIKNINFVEMKNPDTCCGFGGTFSYKFEDLSVSMVERKCRYIEESGAEFCVGADSSCLLNIEGFLRKQNMKAKTIHIADLLAKSLLLD